MSLSKDLTVTITNETEGTTLVLKTVSALGTEHLTLSGDPGVYAIKDLMNAIEEIKLFHMLNKKEPIFIDREFKENEMFSGIHLP